MQIKPMIHPSIKATKRWVETVVVGLNLCPFAKHELQHNHALFTLSEADTEELLLNDLATELHRLNNDETIQTSLLIHPNILHQFEDYNQFLDHAERLLNSLKLNGVYQIASFHPSYQFAGTKIQDAENYTNRSPYPMLHLIREQSLEQALESFPDIDKVPERNIHILNKKGAKQMRALLKACYED